VLYAPLYIAGPILTFNDFMWQVHTVFFSPWLRYTLRPSFCLSFPKEVAPLATMRIAIHFCITLLTMETIIDFMLIVAIKDAHAWSG
jgi:D-alanyl-lipoteichoic acid acyltransferase DltB (MBOAT superfamily)